METTLLVRSPYDEFANRNGATPRRGVFGLFVHELGRRIVGGTFTEGESLPNEDELIGTFGVSRTILREGMKCLAGKGLIEIRTKVGTRVRPRVQWHQTDPDIMIWHYETGPTLQYLKEIRDLRRLIEPGAAARAARRATGEDIDTIAAALARMKGTIGDIDANADADMAFHSAIFAATHNVVLARMIDIIAIAIFGNKVSQARKGVVEGQRMSIPFHEDVFVAIRDRDPDAAHAAANRLLDSWLPAGLKQDPADL